MEYLKKYFVTVTIIIRTTIIQEIKVTVIVTVENGTVVN